jgi:hypothetical protein
MKSLIRKIFVLAVFGLLTTSFALAQGVSAEASVEAVAETTDSAGAASSESTEPPPPQPSAAMLGAAVFETGVEPTDEMVLFNLAGPTAAGSGSSRKVLVIPNTEIKPEDLAAITQDLQVMSHIFHKIFTGPRLIEGVFMDYGDFFGRGSRATEAVYLQGYGTLFLMEVNIQLSSPPKAKEIDKDETIQKPDSVWQQATQEIFQPSAFQNTRRPDSGEKFDAEKVEELKSRLIKALKHAANMRNLKPDEWIILTVIGKGRSYGVGGYGGGMMGGYGGGMGGYGGGMGGYGGGMGGYGGGGAVSVGRSDSRTGSSRYITTRIVPGGAGVSSHTVLTIRAKKSDVDAFAQDKMDYDNFREKVQIITYPYFGSKSVRPTSSNVAR